MKKIIIIVSLLIGLVSIKADYAYSSDLSNAVSALKIMAGDAVTYPDADVDGNGKVELQDAVCALQILAGLRAERPDIVLFVPTDTDKITLAWLGSDNNPTSSDEMNYEVHLSEQENFEPSVSTRRAAVKGEIQKEITGLETGTTYYAVIVAVDKEKNQTKGKYGSVTTFALPVIKSSITSETDSNLGLNNGVQNGTEYTYPKTADSELPQVGSVLFANVGEDVYMRKVNSVNTTSGNIVVQTGDAELAEVFEQATVDTNLTLFDVNEVSAKSVRRADGSRYSVARWKDDLLVAEHIDHSAETDDISLAPGLKTGEHVIRIKRGIEEQAGVSAGVSFTPALNNRILWKKTPHGIEITGAEVIAKGTLSAYIDAYYNFSAAGSVEKEIPFPLFTRTFTTRYMLGAVPVYQRTTFSLKALISASAESEIKANANAKASAGIEMGVRYNIQTGAWDVIPLSPDFQKSFTADISVHGGVHGEVRLIPNIQVEFYRMLAADLSIEPFLAGDIQAETMGKADIIQGFGYLKTQLTQLDFYLQAEGFIGVSFGVFSKKTALLEKTKIYTSPKWMLFNLPKLEVSGGSGKVGEPISLTAITTDGTNNPFDSGSIRWLVYPPDKGSVTEKSSSLELDDNGNYKISITAEFVAKEEDTYTVFFSGNSKLGEPFGRQFAFTEISFSNNLSGEWLLDSTVITISQTGQQVDAVYKTLPSSAENDYGWKSGDQAVYGTIEGQAITGKIQLHFPIKYKTLCPDKWSSYKDIVFTISEGLEYS